MHNGNLTTPQTEKGQSLVELAVFLAFMVLLLAGIVDFGRAFFTFIAMRHAAQEGVIYGSLFPGDCIDIVDRVEATSDYPVDMDAEYITISVFIDGDYWACADASKACVGNEVRVRVDYSDFPITMPLLGTIVGSQTIPISSEAAGVILKPGCP